MIVVDVKDFSRFPVLHASKTSEQTGFTPLAGIHIVTYTINTGADKDKHHRPKNIATFIPIGLCLFVSGSLVQSPPPDFTLERSVLSAPGHFTALN